MALDNVLARLRSGELVTPVAPSQWEGVTPKPVPVLAVTRVTPVSPPETEARTETQEPVALSRGQFSSQGVYLLADDLAYLRWHLPTGTSARNAAVREYVRRWHEAMEGEPVEYRKDNAGRRAANTWLRSQYHLRGANRADRKVEL
tara:strand:- start:39099 stop:39536 length:438 start_codon:yes stop_codon:yes gene_type:complete